MANIFRNFQMQKVGSQSCNSLGAGRDVDDSTSGWDIMRKPIRLLSHSRSRGHLKGDRSDSSNSRGEGSEGEEDGDGRADRRKHTRKMTAKSVMKDGVSLIRSRLRKITRSPHFSLDSDNSPCDSPISPKSPKLMHRQSSGSSCGSKSRSTGYASQDNIPEALKDDADQFKTEVTRSEKLHAFRDYIMERTCGEDGVMDKEVVSRWNETINAIISEAWHIAEQIFRAQWKKAEYMMEQSREAQKNCREAHCAYQKEVTALRDQLRDLPPGSGEALKHVFYSPLQHHDAATRELVMACSEERLKSILLEADKEDSTFGLHISQKVEEKCAEIKRSEQRRMESVFQLERDDLQRCISRLQGESERLRVELDQARTDSAQAASRTGDAEKELQSTARQSMAEAAKLRQDLEQAHAEINSLTERIEIAQVAIQAANAADREREAALRPAESAAPSAASAASRPAQSAAPPALRPAEKASSAAPPNAAPAALRPAEKASSAVSNAAPDGAESRPMLPGASANELMEHAVHLHDGLDDEKSDKIVSATDLLTVLERLGEQLQIEVRQEATDALPEAFEGSLVIMLLTAHAQMARRHGTALLPIAILFLKSTVELSSIAQGKATCQMKVSSFSRHLVDLRSEACKLLSACFSCAHNGFQGLEGLRNRLRSSPQLDSRGASATSGRGPCMSPLSDCSEREVRISTAPDLSSMLSDDHLRKTESHCSSNADPFSPRLSLSSNSNVEAPSPKQIIGGKFSSKIASKATKSPCPQNNGKISMCDAVDLPLKQTVTMGTPRGQVQTKGGNQVINRRPLVNSSGSSGGIQRICSDTLDTVTPLAKGTRPPRSPTATMVVPQMAESVLVTNVPGQNSHGNSRQARRKSVA